MNPEENFRTEDFLEWRLFECLAKRAAHYRALFSRLGFPHYVTHVTSNTRDAKSRCPNGDLYSNIGHLVRALLVFVCNQFADRL